MNANITVFDKNTQSEQTTSDINLRSTGKDTRSFVKSMNERKRIRTKRNNSQLPDHIYFNTSGSIIPTMNDDYEEELPPFPEQIFSNGKIAMKSHGHLSQQFIQKQKHQNDMVFENRSDEAIYFNDKISSKLNICNDFKIIYLGQYYSLPN